MKKNLLRIIIILITSPLIYSQVGINTNTPQNTLHVVGKTQFTGQLNVGGDANTSGDNGEAGAVLISQGNNAAPKWLADNTKKAVVLGDLSEATGIKSASSSGGIYYTGFKIQLTKGVWALNAGILHQNLVSSRNRRWINFYFSSSKTKRQNNGYNKIGKGTVDTPDIAGASMKINGSYTTPKHRNSVIIGSTIIEVTAENITIYLLAQSTGSNEAIVGGGWEDYLYAIPLN